MGRKNRMNIMRVEKDIDVNMIYSAIVKVAIAERALLSIIFGSFARSDFSRKSDIDLIFVEDTEERFIDRIAKYYDALKDQKVLKSYGLDVFVYTPQEYENMKKSENRFILKAIEEGKILYEYRKK